MTLARGDVFSLFEQRPETIRVLVAFGWQPRPGARPDVDVSAFLLGVGAQVLSDQHFVFYNNPVSPDGSVRLLGDARPESTRGDTEAVSVALLEVPPQVMRIRFAVSVYEPAGLSLADLRGTYLRLLDADGGAEIARYEASELPERPAAVLGELYRFAGRWKFHALEDASKDGVHGIAAGFGVNV